MCHFGSLLNNLDGMFVMRLCCPGESAATPTASNGTILGGASMLSLTVGPQATLLPPFFALTPPLGIVAQ